MKTTILAILVFLCTACGTTSGDASSEKLTGAGATFPLPFYNLAFKTYRDSTGVNVTYGGIGSGGGIRSLKDRIVDFAGSDAYLSDSELTSMPDSVIHIPSCMGAIVLAYNLPGIKGLKLSGDVISDIYLGNITQWNDSRLRELNPELNLPSIPIHPVYRSDGSGTTFVFSDYLTKVSPLWKEKVGHGKALNWPVGLAAKGNPGVSGTISQTQGAIGYIGSEYAFAQKLDYASLRNRAGNFIVPSTETISAAASIALPSDTRTMITDAEGEHAYPISCFTWILVYRDQSYDKRSYEHAESLVRLLSWLLSTQAQDLASKVHYAPLSSQAVEQSQALLGQMTYHGEKLFK